MPWIVRPSRLLGGGKHKKDTRVKLVLLEALCALVKRLDAKIVFFVGIGLLGLLDRVVCQIGLPGSVFIDGILVWKQVGADCTSPGW